MSEYGNGNIAALFGKPFDPNAHEPLKTFEVLPPGQYTCLIESAGLKNTRSGSGKYIKVTLRVIEETFAKDRKFFDNINIQNTSEDCQRLGIAQLSSLGRAAQCYPVNDTADLVDKVVLVAVGVKKREDTGENQNTVRTYKLPPTIGSIPYAPALTPAPVIGTSIGPGPAVPPVQTLPPPAAPVAPTAAAIDPAPPTVPMSGPATGGVSDDAPWKR